MKQIPFIPENSPFTVAQRAWINGYLAGVFSDANNGTVAAPVLTHSKPAEPLLVFFGSQTGTAEALAKRIASEAKKKSFQPRVLEMNAFAGVEWKNENRLLIVTSTWGDGDPPDNAAAFWNFLNSETAPRLEHLHFSVLALGDRNYADFCGAGKKFDERLEQLGAKRIHSRADCDTDYEAAASMWINGVWSALEKIESHVADPATKPSSRETGHQTREVTVHNRQNPFPARLLANRRLNAPGSTKDTRHIEISLKDSGMTYEAGDALGVLPTNCPALVDEILCALGCDGEEAVKNPAGAETSFRNALLHSFQITQIPLQLLAAFSERSRDTDLRELLEPARKAELEKFVYGREIIDLLREFPSAKFSPVEFAGFLRKLQPRLYSISSSPRAHFNEVHLTVAVVRYESHGRERKGVCSTFLADRAGADAPVPVFIQTSHGFRLPLDSDKPVIMIGPGTGIAPFRAFLEERRAIGAHGKNWIFFGDQKREFDFLYREELEAMLADGTLTRLDTAFSRDQAEKIYVQQRMLENAGEFWAWLENGAHVYVCGDAKRMAKDVELALRKIIQIAGTRTPEQAEEYMQKLKTEKRYQRDVY